MSHRSPSSPPSLAGLRAQVAAFAQAEIAARSDLRDHSVMPADLWQAVGEAGLARIGLPAEYGGDGSGFSALAVTAETMAAEGGVKGVVTSWLGRQLIARLQILGHGSPAQRSAFLPAIAAGRLTPCLAISEPGAGAHPKHLKATAVRVDGGYVLNGEKAYVTNGPIADIVLVLAVTGESDGRKAFSVLIVPRDTPGVVVTEGVKVDYLRPAPHCGFRFDDVRVPSAGLLGPEGEAFAAISLPMRRAEDALAAASTAGALRHEIRLLAREAAATGRAIEGEDLAELGFLAAVPDGLSALAGRAAGLMDDDPVVDRARVTGPDTHEDEIATLATAARDWARMAQERISALTARCLPEPSSALAAAKRDLEKTLGIARGAHTIQAQRRGQALLADRGHGRATTTGKNGTT